MVLYDDLERRAVLGWFGALPPAWHSHAACRNFPGITFFPGRGQTSAPAKKVCNACPVALACLATAITNGETFGVWGGTSERERRQMRRAP